MAGLARGTTTRVMIWNSPPPSTRAASTSSSGIVMKNCRSRKIENASPKKAGTISGFSDGIHWNRENTMYRGTTVTWNGSISVERTSTKDACRPLQRILESA